MGGEKLNACKRFLAVIFTAVFIIFSIPVFAQDAGNSAMQPSAVQPSAAQSSGALSEISEDTILLGDIPIQETGPGDTSIWIVIRMVIVLALAALAIYGVVFFIKRLARPPQARDPNLKLLASIPLAGDTFAAVISVGAKAWLVGGGSGAGVSLISEINETEALEIMLLDDARKNAEANAGRFPDFRSFLNRFNKPRNKLESQQDFDAQMESLRKQQERLKRLQS